MEAVLSSIFGPHQNIFVYEKNHNHTVCLFGTSGPLSVWDFWPRSFMLRLKMEVIHLRTSSLQKTVLPEGGPLLMLLL